MHLRDLEKFPRQSNVKETNESFFFVAQASISSKNCTICGLEAPETSENGKCLSNGRFPLDK